MARTANLQQHKKQDITYNNITVIKGNDQCLMFVNQSYSQCGFSCVMMRATNPLPTSVDNCVNTRDLQNMF